MLTRKFWRDALERSVSTAAEAVLLVLGGDVFFDAVHADWATVGGAAAGGAFLALVKSLAAVKVGGDDNASLDPAQRTILGKA